MSGAGGGPVRRVAALVRKEGLQILRDPSAYLIAGVLPVVLMLIFGYGVSLDLRGVPVAVVVERTSPEATSLLDAYRNSHYFRVRVARHRAEAAGEVVAGRLRGMVVIPDDFAPRLGRGDPAPVQVIVDGSDPNTAGLVLGYAQGVWQNWLAQEALSRAGLAGAAAEGLPEGPGLATVPRAWFNQQQSSRDALLPGAVAIILTLIGTMLTALVVAREWERGTMEALLATPAGRFEVLVGKMLPYFVLGMAAVGLASGAAVGLFGVPLRGSVGALAAVSAVYLVVMLALGLVISTKAKNQFVACQAALIVGYLPALLLSGLLFEIDAMPAPIRMLTRLLPPRYFVASLQTVFLAGDVWGVLAPNMAVLALFAAVLLAVLVRALPRRLD